MNAEDNNPSRVCDRKEAARILGFRSTVSIKRLEKAGKLKPIWLNSRVVRYYLDDVQKLITEGSKV